MRSFPAALTVGVLAIFTTHAGAAADPEVSGAAAPRDGQHDFDFIFGGWKIHLKRRTSAAHGPSQWSEFDGFGFYRKVWEGRANLNEFEADSPSGHVEGLTLRTYNPATHQWSLYWANSHDGILTAPQVGQFHDGIGEFYAQDSVDGKSVFVRFVWSRITATSAHFEQAFSADGGRTWDVNWISDMVRTDDRVAEAAVAAQARTAAQPPATSRRDGQHDFDPLLGSWKYRLKRRTHPLTGSTDWVELNGRGVCYPLWTGRAQLDTFYAEGPGGRIEGLTLRLYDPRSQQWRLSWANSRDGNVVVPQIGEFVNGRGEFYASDTLNEKSILVRFDWTALDSKSPHFEQSFSNDGGNSWEVNWITDQTRVADTGAR